MLGTGRVRFREALSSRRSRPERVESVLVAHIAEVDARRLFESEASS